MIQFEKITLTWLSCPYNEVPEQAGIYQIYGTSPLYGMDVLLYIGKADNLKGRLNDHFANLGTIGRQPNKSCRYAVLPKELTEIVEQTLILMHKPSLNSSSINNMKTELKKKPIYIQNEGERGMLNIEVTNYYFLHAAAYAHEIPETHT